MHVQSEPEDSLPGVFEHDTHDCDRFDIADTLESLGAAARSMATFAESLTPAEQAVIAVYSKEQVINTTAVIRHALHDAEHHLLDVRRGIARQQLRRRRTGRQGGVGSNGPWTWPVVRARSASRSARPTDGCKLYHVLSY